MPDKVFAEAREMITLLHVMQRHHATHLIWRETSPQGHTAYFARRRRSATRGPWCLGKASLRDLDRALRWEIHA